MPVRRWVLASLALVLVGFGERSSCWPQASAPEPVAAITRVEGSGTVVVRALDGSTRKGRPGLALRVGDKVVGEPPSRTTVVYVDRQPQVLDAAAVRVEHTIRPAETTTTGEKLLRALKGILRQFTPKLVLVDPAASAHILYRVLCPDINASALYWGEPPDWGRASRAKRQEDLGSLLVEPVPTPTLSLVRPDTRVFRWSASKASFVSQTMERTKGPWRVIVADEDGGQLWESPELGATETPFPDQPSLAPGQRYYWHVTRGSGQRIGKSEAWWFEAASPDAAQTVTDEMAAVGEWLQDDVDEVTQHALRSAILLEHGFCDTAEEEAIAGLKAEPTNGLLQDLLQRAIVAAYGPSARIAGHSRQVGDQTAPPE